MGRANSSDVNWTSLFWAEEKSEWDWTEAKDNMRLLLQTIWDELDLTWLGCFKACVYYKCALYFWKSNYSLKLCILALHWDNNQLKIRENCICINGYAPKYLLPLKVVVMQTYILYHKAVAYWSINKFYDIIKKRNSVLSVIVTVGALWTVSTHWCS